MILTKQKIAEAESYWIQQLKGVIGNTFVLDYNSNSKEIKYIENKLDKEISGKLVGLCKNNDLSVFVFLMSVANIVLSKSVLGNEVIIASPVLSSEIKKYNKWVLFRNHVDPNMSFKQLLMKINKTVIEGYKNQFISVDRISDNLEIQSQGNLFQISLSLDILHGSEYKNTEESNEHEDLSFVFSKLQDEISLSLKYNSLTIDKTTVQSLFRQFENILKQVVNNVFIEVNKIDYQRNNQEMDSEDSMFLSGIITENKANNILDIFAEQVNKNSHSIALVSGNKQLTYKSLNQEANKIAAYLNTELKLSKGSCVGLLFERSEFQIISLLGILKSGCYFLPLDSSLPQRRLEGMLKDSGVSVILTQKAHIGLANNLQWNCPDLKTFCCLDSDNVHEEKEEDKNKFLDSELWNSVAKNATDDIDAGGWLSSFTGLPFSKEEMEEYASNIHSKILPHVSSESRVLEIGVASGLSMFKIAPHVKHYVGTDISDQELRRCREKANREDIENITLKRTEAINIDEFEEGQYDLIVINSVIQAFHGYNYLRQVIKKAINLLKNSGRIFVGDVMDLDLKQKLLNDLVDFKNENQGKGFQTKTDVSSELFVAKDFFNDLKSELPFVKEVDISGKISTLENELTKYRFDVVLEVNKENIVDKTPKTKNQHDKRTLSKCKNSEINTDIKINLETLAYLIYTSGTTGNPKGVLLEHKGVVNLNNQFRNNFGVNINDNIIQFANISFDASVWDIFMTLLNGATLNLVTKETIDDPNKFTNFIDRNQISVATLPPTFLNAISDSRLNSVRLLVTAGEKANVDIVNKWKNKLTYINAYGPTEYTVCISYWNASVQEKIKRTPIGKPICNTNVFVLDNELNQLPENGIGELYSGGPGLARGYMNNPELTNERFIKSPFNASEYLYKSGDIVRILPERNIEFIDRVDRQIKIRGHRVELKEIEQNILSFNEIKEVVVVEKTDASGDTYLVSFYTADSPLDSTSLSKMFSSVLPKYMIPRNFYIVDKIPVTTSGKIDYEALTGQEEYIKEFINPENELEKKLAEIWGTVLGIDNEKISVNDNFFEIGGHSLKAMMLINKFQEELGVAINITDVFNYPTIKEFALEYQNQINYKVEKEEKFSEKKEYYKTSSAQKRLFILQQINVEAVAYNMPFMLSLGKEVNKEKISEIFSILIDRHEVFRTSFDLLNGEPVQRIYNEVDLKFHTYTALKSEVYAIRENFVQAFDLSNAPLLRVGIIEIEGEDNILMMDIHHIIGDGVSHVILKQEFQSLYSGNTLPPVKFQYKEYSEWQNSKEFKTRIKDQENYWLNKFAGDCPVLNLLTDYLRPPVQSYTGAMVNFVLSKEESKIIKDLSKENDLTLYMTILAVFKILLSKLSGQEEIIVGTPVSNRNKIYFENVIGMFINTLAIRSEVANDTIIKEFLKGLKKDVLDSFDNQSFQFEDLVDKVSIERDMGRNPIFDVMCNLLNHTETSEDLSEFTDKKYVHTNGISKFDMSLTATDCGEQFLFNLSYNTSLFKPETIENFIKFFRNIVNQLPKKINQKLNSIDLLSIEEQNGLNNEIRSEIIVLPENKTIIQLIEEQADNLPDKSAVIVGEDRITYSELSEKTDKLAYYLRQEGIIENSVVALYLEPSVEMMVSILGVLKAGGVFVPISPEIPADRAKWILKDAGANLIVSSSQLLKHELDGVNRIELDEINWDSNCDCIDSYPKLEAPAYIIYTSGTTGNPKGVIVTHKNLLNYFSWFNKISGLTNDDITALVTSYAFDLGYTALFSSLIIGCQLHLLSKDIYMSQGDLVDYIVENKVTYLKITPSLFTILTSQDNFEKVINSLRLLIMGGEEINAKAVKKAFSLNENIRIMNHYGPTEGTIGCVTHLLDKFNQDKFLIRPVIGKPIHNMNAYVLNSNYKMQPKAVAGQLFISGEGVALGYLNKPELTFEKFKNNSTFNGERIYSTGDKVRMLSNGDIEFMGRVDHQVKIRGFRIELSEIENTLQKHELIKESIVVCKEVKGDKFLCAYVVCKKEFNYELIRNYLGEKLPEYMVPQHFMELESLPLTSNGKVNRNVLPLPEIKTSDDYVAPKTKKERLLVDIWSKVLGVEGIGVMDNFFQLGGDSIKSIQIQARLNKYGYKLTVRDIFENLTISRLVSKVELKIKEVSQKEVIGDIKLTPIQHRFFNNKTDLHHYNQSIMMYPEERLDEEKIRLVFKKLQIHHDALRITCKYINGNYSLYNESIEKSPLSFNVYDLRNEENAIEKLTECANKIQRSIDLENGSLMKIGLFHLDDGDRLLIVIHHLVIDGVSWRIIFEDIEMLYDQAKKGDELSLPLKSNSFMDWSKSITEYAKSNKLLKEKEFWDNITNLNISQLKRDINDERLGYNDFGNMQFSLDEEDTSHLLTKTNEVYGTELNDILLCGLGYGVRKVLGNEKVLISLEGHGREDIFTDIDISRTIGWFTSEFPILLDMKYSDNLSMQIKQVKESLHQIPEKGIGYGILKYITPIDLKEFVQFNNEPQIAFNYLGQFDSDVKQMSQFSIAKESRGQEVSLKREGNYDFLFGGMIARGRLSITVRFKKKYYSEELISDLLDNYRNSIIDIINHCINASVPKNKSLIDNVVIESEAGEYTDEVMI